MNGVLPWRQVDHILVRNLTPRGSTGKLRGYWEDMVYVVKGRKGPNSPVYAVEPLQGTPKPVPEEEHVGWKKTVSFPQWNLRMSRVMLKHGERGLRESEGPGVATPLTS